MQYQFFLVSTLTLLISCGSGSSKDNDNSEVQETSEIGSSYLNGTWSTGCFSPATGIYRTQSFTFNELSYTDSIVWFEDEMCTIPDDSYEEVHNSGSIIYGALVRAESGVDARKIDIVKVVSDSPRITEIYYSIFYLDNDVLFFGDHTSQYAGYTEPQRHRDLDYNYPFQRSFP